MMCWWALALSHYGDPGRREHAALVALYNATGGANWANNDGWLGSAGADGGFLDGEAGQP